MYKIYKNKEELVKNLISKTDVVLDVGFWGQGVKYNQEDWVHRKICNYASEVYGLDLDFDSTKLKNAKNYQKGNAENFKFSQRFDVIFAADLIEHLSNPGLFLESCKKNLKENGRLILTTPNCFNLFNIAEKISKPEPTVNKDHTSYLNIKTISQLLAKNDWELKDAAFLYSLDSQFRESLKKRFLNIIYFILSKFTPKFIETLVVVAEPRHFLIKKDKYAKFTALENSLPKITPIIPK